ncbi:MAG TPA: flagellar biosynthetic protein FliQ, partial [Polyangia bacterium]
MSEVPEALMHEGMLLLASTAGPFVGGLLLVGLVVGILQSATQINDPAVGFLP